MLSSCTTSIFKNCSWVMFRQRRPLWNDVKNRLQHKLHCCHKNNKDNAAIAEKLDRITAVVSNTGHKLWDQTQLSFSLPSTNAWFRNVKLVFAANPPSIFGKYTAVFQMQLNMVKYFVCSWHILILLITWHYVTVNVKNKNKNQQQRVSVEQPPSCWVSGRIVSVQWTRRCQVQN